MASPDEYQALLLGWRDDLRNVVYNMERDRGAGYTDEELEESLANFISDIDKICSQMTRILWPDVRGVSAEVMRIVNEEALRRIKKAENDAKREIGEAKADYLLEMSNLRSRVHNIESTFESRVEEEVQRRMYGPTTDAPVQRKRVVMI